MFVTIFFLVPHLLWSVLLMDKLASHTEKENMKVSKILLWKEFFSLGATHEISWESLVNSFFLSHSKIILKESIFNSLIKNNNKKNILELGRKVEHQKKFVGLFSPDRHMEGAPQHTVESKRLRWLTRVEAVGVSPPTHTLLMHHGNMFYFYTSVEQGAFEGFGSVHTEFKPRTVVVWDESHRTKLHAVLCNLE